MSTHDLLSRAGLFTENAPRYTSYPTAPMFHEGVGALQVADWLRRSDAGQAVSLYLHIPFCERLCWFCACRTQGTRTHAPVASYVDTLVQEIGLIAALLPGRRRVGRLHWGGGTPTILEPAEMTRLSAALAAAFDLTGAEFSVEIDPTCVDEARLDALVAAGLGRASLGIQDFASEVQKAIGRDQSFEVTARAVAGLRARGVSAINTDLVYGLPDQSQARLDRTLDLLMDLAPARVALFGYAHVPWMARRQRMIREEALPDPHARHALFADASARLQAEGYQMIGIDHFARPEDSMAVAARQGRLRRNFQGYTDEPCPILLGLGASAISRFPQGYAQNAAATAAYQARIREGRPATSRGFAMGIEDRLRARAIEMLMCDFRIDLVSLRAEFGDAVSRLVASCRAAVSRYAGALDWAPQALTILPEARALTRLIAREFDAYAGGEAQHSQAV